MANAALTPARRAVAAPALPIRRLVLGKPVAEAVELLPRLFNLCRAAQETALRAALGLPLGPGWQETLRREILREHVAKLCLKWPGLLGLAPLRLPPDWSLGGPDLRRALFGPPGTLPPGFPDFLAFLDSDHGIAPVLRAISRHFAAGEACRNVLPMASPANIFAAGLCENSVATRQVDHLAMRGIEARWGRGPLWTATALAYDLEGCLRGDLPRASLATGRAVLPAARGLYGVSAKVERERVAALHRVTPTDHLLAPGGALDQSLASLPAEQAGSLAPLLLAIMDPCYPVSLEPVRQREDCDA